MFFNKVTDIQKIEINKIIGITILKKDKSKLKIFKEINLIASNCSNGENINYFNRKYFLSKILEYDKANKLLKYTYNILKKFLLKKSLQKYKNNS